MVSKNQQALNDLRAPIAYTRLQPSVSGDTAEVVAEKLWADVLVTVERAVAKTGGKPHRIKINGILQIYVVPPEVD